ncbi:MAG: thiamine pyrophosphate-binding protein [Syntrophorhabdaceae bacterium]|nr:thiamine pyrophosphate-binding protein [Syntrophorhabdaceae bacterium]
MQVKYEISIFLKEKNINNVFYLPGIHTISLDEALTSNKIKIIMGRHESNIVYMADGYSRVSGGVGVVFVTPGPGLGNVVSGCMEAYGDDTPIIIVHIDTKRDEHGRGILHEVAEPENIFRYFTKKTFYASSVHSIIPTLKEAYKTATTGRKGPVVISIPFALLDKEPPSKSEKTDDHQAEEIKGQASQHLKDAIEEIEAILKNKVKPAIICGKSAMFDYTGEILKQVCIDASIPFFTTTGGKGIIDERSYFCLGNVMQKGITNKTLSEADIVIAIGTRLRDVDAKRRGVKIKELIHIDIDDRWLGKNYPATIGLSYSIKDFLYGLKDLLRRKTFGWKLDSIKKEQEAERYALLKKQKGFMIIDTIRASIPEDTITVWDLNLISYWAEYYFPVYGQRTFIMPRGISPIFYALPASIGAKIGTPDRPCLSICGDGGALPGISELSTIKKYNIPVVILVYNNEGFGILEDAMRKRYGIEGSMGLINPDFTKMARAFDIKAKKTDTIAGLKKILQDITWDEPYLIEFRYPLFTTPWDI